MALYHRMRPKTFEKVIGNEDVIEALKTTIVKPDHPHSYLFTGPTGCGKTTLGRIVANELGCQGNDFREVDSADFRGIDTVREIRKQSQFRPLEGPCKVWLIDEVHKATNDAQNALLKALEDTPKHVYYILCTTDPQKLIATIKGRCSQFQVRLLNDSEMFKLLRSAVKIEEESLARPIYEQIVKSAEGHPRNALQILDQVLSVDPEKRLAVAEKAKEDSYQVIELFKALINNTGWKKVANILEGLKDIPPEDIRRQILGLCAGTLLKRDEMRAGLIMENFIDPFYNTNFPGLVFACYSVMKDEE